MKVLDIYNAIDKICDFESAYPWDNVGLLVGDKTAEVTRVLVTLDADLEALKAAKKIGANLVVSHHPIVYDALKKITPDVAAFHYIANGVNVISAHTCLDAAKGGVSDTLALACGLKNIKAANLEGVDILRVGDSDISDPDEFCKFVKNSLPSERCDAVICGPVKRVICGGGSGGAVPMEALALGADTLVTGECKHNVFVACRNLGINIFSFGHYETENPIVNVLTNKLKEALPDMEFVAFCDNNPVHRR